jgi:antitoxin HicB
MMSEIVKDIAHYLSLPYATVLRRDEDGDTVARIEELPGCVAHGKDEAEAIENLKSMQKLWIEECIAGGNDVPEPESEESLPSGKFVQRVPRSLHRQLTRMAKHEGVSLNQLVTSILSQAVSGAAWEKVAERLLCKYLPTEASDMHGWAYPTNLIAGHAIDWSMD